ncbi:MFS transporter [Paenalcaligenes niemegkensis]|uniref:MFS transporter n=1 Tax=Paenalcaligenes niemegkensis TaxID=2895469 RepID=UPI001EE8126E|nr:MFS transporter [Paenalcaligenes niemegkensis]MCQ9617878.1 MFS transporter [Paenalcaligenes niemegkensis]
MHHEQPQHLQEISTKISTSAKLAQIIDDMGFGRAHKLILMLVIAGVFFDVIEQNAIGIVGPVLQADWGISAAQIGLINSVTFFCMSVGGIIAGFMADRYGRRPILMLNLILYSIGALLCSIAPNYEMLVLFRGIVGLGLGGELATAIIMVAEFSPTKNRASAVSTLNLAGGGLGNFAAPLYGVFVLGLLAPAFGLGDSAWRWVFGLLVLPIVFIAFFRRYLPETPRFLLATGQIHECNRALTILKHGRLIPRGHPVEVEQFLTETGDVTLKRTEKIRIGEIFAKPWRRRTLAVSTTYFMALAGQISILTLMPVILVSKGFSIVAGVGFTAVMQSGSLAGALMAVIVNAHLKRKTVIAMGTLGAMLSAIAFGLFAESTASILFLGALFQFFVLLLNTTLWTWLPELYPTRIRGFGTGVIRSVGAMGAVVMTPIAGLIFDVAGLVAIFATLAVLYLMALIAAMFGPETAGKSLEELSETAA